MDDFERLRRGIAEQKPEDDDFFREHGYYAPGSAAEEAHFQRQVNEYGFPNTQAGRTAAFFKALGWSDELVQQLLDGASIWSLSGQLPDDGLEWEPLPSELDDEPRLKEAGDCQGYG